MFNGLTGLLLGWAAFPAILVALVLQAVMFGFGGITVLGVNTAIIAVPALASYWLFGRGLRAGRTGGAFARGAAAGALAIAVTGVLVALALALTGREFLTAAELVLLAHLPVMGLEALVTGAAVALIARVKPELLAGGHGATADPLPVPDLPAAEATAHEKSRHG
jgi:cobalt/nickel transport system permease protein